MNTFDITDIVGKQFHDLTVVEHVRTEPRKSARGNSYFYLCRCKCGKEVVVVRCNLRHGHTRSCGCKKKARGKQSKCWTGYGEISGRFWAHIKRHADDRDLKFSITIEDAWKQFQKQNARCALSGLPLILESNKAVGYSKKTASLDRIDNNLGYTKDNIQWLHKDVNWMKGKFETDRLLDLCFLITEHTRSSLCC